MKEEKVQGIIETMKKVIYPEVVKKDLVDDSFIKRSLADMICVFGISTSPTEKLYLKPEMQEILKEEGYDICETAFENYNRDLSVVESKVSHHGKMARQNLR